jgi:hypothetical protein
MRAVWKYSLSAGKRKWLLKIPQCSELVYAGHQKGQLHVWFEVETEDAKDGHTEDFYVYMIDTGSPIPDGVTHIHSWEEPPYIYHLYGGISPEDISKYEGDEEVDEDDK